MSDIVERLGFDAVRCELQFSKGVAGNIEEAAAEIERLRAENDFLRKTIRNTIEAQDFNEARRALADKEG